MSSAQRPQHGVQQPRHDFGRKPGVMSKLIISPSKRWPGTVTIADPLTMPQAELIEEGMGTSPEKTEGAKPGRWLLAFAKHHLPMILACVEKWELANFPEIVTPETFPISPRMKS